MGLVVSCRRGEGRSSPGPNDLRGQCSHHSGAGRLRPVIPAACATVSVITDVLACKEAYRMVSPSATIPVFGPHCVGFLSSLLASSFRPVRSLRSLRPGDSASKLLKGCSRLCGSLALNYAFAWGVRRGAVRLPPRACVAARTARATGPSPRPRRALRRPEYQFGPPRSGIQLTGYHHSRPARKPGRGGAISGFLTNANLGSVPF